MGLNFQILMLLRLFLLPTSYSPYDYRKCIHGFPQLAMRRSRGGDRGSGAPLKNHKNIGFLSNTGPETPF